MLTDRERAVLLAALRFWQRQGPLADNHRHNHLPADEREAFADIASDCGAFRALSIVEIDRLCEELNGITASSPDQPGQLAEPCDCQRPGYFCSGVPGILAHVEDCRLSPSAKVERCDLCRRYPTDEAARAKLCELGFAQAASFTAPNL